MTVTFAFIDKSKMITVQVLIKQMFRRLLY